MIIQESEEMYLETIYLLSKKRLAVHSVDVAEELNYSRPSVSRAVGLLKDRGYITVARNGEITLTEEGKIKAEGVYDRHLLLTRLLVRVGAGEKTAEENACRIEHVITPELFDILKKFAEENL